MLFPRKSKRIRKVLYSLFDFTFKFQITKNLAVKTARHIRLVCQNIKTTLFLSSPKRLRQQPYQRE